MHSGFFYYYSVPEVGSLNSKYELNFYLSIHFRKIFTSDVMKYFVNTSGSPRSRRPSFEILSLFKLTLFCQKAVDMNGIQSVKAHLHVSSMSPFLGPAPLIFLMLRPNSAIELH